MAVIFRQPHSDSSLFFYKFSTVAVPTGVDSDHLEYILKSSSEGSITIVSGPL